MAITAYPFDDEDTTETQYSQLFRELQDSGVVDSFGGTGFAVSADSSDMAVSVQSGSAIVRGHMVVSTAIEELTIGAAAGSTRIDRVVLRLDPSTNDITLAVVAGTPGAGVPALTQTDTGVYEEPLAKVTVAPGSVTVAGADVADDRRYVSSRVGVWTTATRPGSPRLSRMGLNTTTDKWEYWDGSAWTDIAAAVSWSAITDKPSTFTPASHTHSWGELTSVPSSFTPAAHSHAWSAITDKPSSFTPSSHVHSASDITSGTISISRLPVGTDASSVSAGSHTHDYAASFHVHPQYLEADQTIHRSNGTVRAHTNNANGPGTWYAVWVDGAGNFMRNTSSARYKENIRPAELDPAAVLALRPAIYDRKETGQRAEFGLIAEQVAETLPEIVVHHSPAEGEEPVVDSVRYDLLAVALLAVVQDQESRIKALEEQVGLIRGTT